MTKRKCIFPPTMQKVFLRTDPKVNAEIRNQTIKNLNIYKNCNAADLSELIRKLNIEWDTERVMEVNAAALILLSSYLGLKMSRFWFLLTGTIGIFLIQHALQGWCPSLPWIRKFGIRTAEEINSEKTVLKMMRGDFKEECADVADMLNVAEKQ